MYLSVVAFAMLRNNMCICYTQISINMLPLLHRFKQEHVYACDGFECCGTSYPFGLWLTSKVHVRHARVLSKTHLKFLAMSSAFLNQGPLFKCRKQARGPNHFLLNPHILSQSIWYFDLFLAHHHLQRKTITLSCICCSRPQIFHNVPLSERHPIRSLTTY
jgi:hypothetical protein